MNTLLEIENALSIKLTSENINQYWDIVYDFCMTNYGETSSETEIMINNLFN